MVLRGRRLQTLYHHSNTRRFLLKYLYNYYMDCHELISILLDEDKDESPHFGDSLTFPVAPTASQTLLILLDRWALTFVHTFMVSRQQTCFHPLSSAILTAILKCRKKEKKEIRAFHSIHSHSFVRSWQHKLHYTCL